MATQPRRVIGVGGHNPSLFKIPGAPTVGRSSLGRWTKLGEEVAYYYRKVAADAINDYMMRIARASLAEVPKGPRQDSDTGEFRVHAGPEEIGSLAASQHNPNNDPSHEADPDYLWAEISYDAEYAAVQHEGEAVMVHHHPIVPGRGGFFERTGDEETIVIEWKAVNYTTPGTKSHYLSDPYKAYIPGLEAFLYKRVREAFLG